MKDYSNYHLSREEKIRSHGSAVFERNKQGFDGKQVWINEEQRQVIWKRKYSENRSLANVYSEHINVGDIIYDGSNNWLAKSLEYDNSIVSKVLVEKCVSSIKWIDQEGEIKESFFIYSDSSSNDLGLDEGQIITLVDGKRYIAVQKNADTLLLDRKRRFIFDHRAWRITNTDKIKDESLIYLVLDEDEINPSTDNRELRIADYKIPVYEMTILNGLTLALKPTETLQINTIVKKDGDLVTSPQLSYQVSDPSIITIDETGLITGLVEGSTTVLIQFRNIVQQIQVTVKAEDIYTIEIVDSSSNPFVIYRGKTKIFNCAIKLNGITTEEQGTFWITADTTDSTTTVAAITTQSNNSCTVSANAIGYCRLHVRNDERSLSTNVRIQVKSIL